MEPGDVDAVSAVVDAANASSASAGNPPPERTAERIAAARRGLARFPEHDPGGAWVAEVDGEVVGMATSVRRGSFWGLAMLFVAPAWQSRGLGRDLLGRASLTAAGARERMIMSSSDPRAMRRYAALGLAMHPAASAKGTIDRRALPVGSSGRPGTAGDLELLEQVDRALLGRSRAPEVGAALEAGDRLEVADGPFGRGFVLFRQERVIMLGATDEATATQLLWRALAEVGDEVSILALSAAQNWAYTVAHAAGLTLAGQGAMFVGGRTDLPGPWIPSGWYF